MSNTVNNLLSVHSVTRETCKASLASSFWVMSRKREDNQERMKRTKDRTRNHNKLLLKKQEVKVKDALKRTKTETGGNRN